MMTAKEYLSEAYRIDQRISSKLEQVERMRALTQRATVSYGVDVVSHTRNVYALQDSVVRMMTAEEELNREIDALVATKVQISLTISKVRKENYRLILEKRYLCYHSWERIADDMQWTVRWVLEQHKRALTVIDRILEDTQK